MGKTQPRGGLLPLSVGSLATKGQATMHLVGMGNGSLTGPNGSWKKGNHPTQFDRKGVSPVVTWATTQ
jgi:hypothetical protein